LFLCYNRDEEEENENEDEEATTITAAAANDDAIAMPDHYYNQVEAFLSRQAPRFRVNDNDNINNNNNQGDQYPQK
tara:strand:+ start:389 stop:616 length:228 start_codon:yes stop_codon:yes gene_type:complete